MQVIKPTYKIQSPLKILWSSFLLGFLILTGCAPRLATSGMTGMTSTNPPLTAVSLADFRQYLGRNWQDSRKAAILGQIADQSEEEFWRTLVQDVLTVHLKVGNNLIYLNEQQRFQARAVARQQGSLNQVNAKPSAQRLSHSMLAEGVDIKSLRADRIVAAYFSLFLLLSGDEELAYTFEPNQLALTDPSTKINEWIKLARLGRKAYGSDLAGATAALDPETWRLIDNNRRILGVAAKVAEQANWQDPRMQTMTQVLKQMLKASDMFNHLGTVREQYQDFIPEVNP